MDPVAAARSAAEPWYVGTEHPGVGLSSSEGTGGSQKQRYGSSAESSKTACAASWSADSGVGPFGGRVTDSRPSVQVARSVEIRATIGRLAVVVHSMLIVAATVLLTVASMTASQSGRWPSVRCEVPPVLRSLARLVRS